MTKLAIIKLITMYSLVYNIDPNISLSVVAVESGFNSEAIGITHDLGLFQLNPKSFPGYSETQLLNPRTNIMLGVKYLAEVKKSCKHKHNNDWLICFNMGVKGAEKVKHPKLFPYVKKIQLAINERNL